MGDSSQIYVDLIHNDDLVYLVGSCQYLYVIDLNEAFDVIRMVFKVFVRVWQICFFWCCCLDNVFGKCWRPLSKKVLWPRVKPSLRGQRCPSIGSACWQNFWMVFCACFGWACVICCILSCRFRSKQSRAACKLRPQGTLFGFTGCVLCRSCLLLLSRA